MQCAFAPPAAGAGPWRRGSVALVALLLTATAMVGADRARAQPPSRALVWEEMDALARKHFETGQSYYELGDYEQALAEFDKAYELSGRPELLYNLSITHEKLGDYADAADALQGYLEREPDLENEDDAPQRAKLEVRLEKLRTRAALQEPPPSGPERDVLTAPALPPSGPERDVMDAPEPQPLAVTENRASAPADRESHALRRNPWLWTAVGVVVLGSVVGAAVAAGGSETRVADPYQGGALGPLEGH